MGRSWLLWMGRVLVLLQLVHGVFGWGKDGHYTICKIAEVYLTQNSLAAVKDLLPESAEGDLASVCSWADTIRRNYRWRWSSPLHYVDTPDFKCNYEYSRDCHDNYGHKDRCVAGAIFNYTLQLSSAFSNSKSGPKYNLTEALMFLSHFIGDVHQPLHVGFTGDEGGNTIVVHWYRRKSNLHHDTWSNDKSSWEYCERNQTVCPNLYASESVRYACKFAYRNATPGSTLGDDYFLTRLPIVEQRLAQGGIRLAATLNRIFASQEKIAEA